MPFLSLQSEIESFEKSCKVLDNLIDEYVKISDTKLNDNCIKFKDKIIKKIKSWSRSCL